MGDNRKITGSGAHSWTEPEGEIPAEPAETAPVAAGVVLAGRYQIRKVIGRGGMGVVVSAYDRTLGATVAIKILRSEYAGERQWAERLAREVRLARQIQHPNVCRVFDFEQADGRVFLVMELARGGTLRSEIASGRGGARLPAERIADARAITAGLAAIHAAGIIHRDVTSSNVLRMEDGRVVLSDFGLATDSFESTTNLRGGTIAYMAPEVVRGGALSFAADVWSLGVVIHETVFGERPRWRDPAGHEMLPPDIGRRLTPEERIVFETCRACTAVEPEQRPASAVEAVTRLAGGRAPWRSRSWSRRVWRAFAVAVSASLVAAAVAIGWWRSSGSVARPFDRKSPMIIPTGQPADWTGNSRVLAQVPDRVVCLVVLPDGHTVRFAWGTPLRSEDLDTATGRRVPSPLVPQAYAEGCPSLSPQGRLLFPGHTSDGRAFAFVSSSSDGSSAEPIVPTAEPTMSSEPVWLPDGESFLIDVDMKHAGVYSFRTKRLDVLPEAAASSNSCFKFAAGHLAFTVQPINGREMEFLGSDWRTFEERIRFRLPGVALDLRSASGEKYLAVLSPPSSDFAAIELSLKDLEARWLGSVKGQYLRYPAVVAPGVVFVSMAQTSEVEIRQSDGSYQKLIERPDLTHVGRCGAEFVATMFQRDKTLIVRIGAEGNVDRATEGPLHFGPACSSDGRVLYYLNGKVDGIERCDASGCRPWAEGIRALGLAMSPRGDRIAFVNQDRRGLRAQWKSTVGGPVHDLSETETACSPVWSSDHALWVSRRRAGKIVWVEVGVDTGRETGRAIPGVRDCSDGRVDPGAPGDSGLRVRTQFVSQVRLLPRSEL